MTPEEKVVLLKKAGVWDVIGFPSCIDKLFDLVAAHEREKQAEQEPVYAFRRKGQDSFCTCDKERYEELSDKPNLFEVATFYAAPVRAKDLTDEEQLELARSSVGKSRHWLVAAVIAKFKEKNK